MKSWSLTEAPKLVPHPIDSRRYDQLLEQVAETLYHYFASSKKVKISSTGIQPNGPRGSERKGS